MKTHSACDFRKISESAGVAVVVCVRCGLKLSVSAEHANSKAVYSACIARDDTKEGQAPSSQHPAGHAHGPGTELSKLLKRFGIEPTPTCQCRAKAQQMDAWGPDECEKPERIDEVVAVMREEAKARGLPFLDAVGRMLVRRAIKLARKNSLDKP